MKWLHLLPRRAVKKPETKVGVIGLGTIGSRVAENLRNSGYKVWLWSRTPKPLPGFLSSAEEVIRHAKIILIFVYDGIALEEVVRSLLSALTREHIIVNHTTISPSETESIAKLIIETGARFLDAPFTGSRDAVEARQLVYYVGGDAKALEEVKPVLTVSSKEILHLGEIGDASLIKIATNMISAATIEALAEALAIVRTRNIDVEKFTQALSSNSIHSEISGAKLRCMISNDYEVRFSMKNMQKDMEIVGRIAHQNGFDIPAVYAFLQHARILSTRGFAEKDVCAINEAYRRNEEEEVAVSD